MLELLAGLAAIVAIVVAVRYVVANGVAIIVGIGIAAAAVYAYENVPEVSIVANEIQREVGL